jgi:hypothetical protein
MAEPNLGVENSPDYSPAVRALAVGTRTVAWSMEFIRKAAILGITLVMLAALWPILMLDETLEERRIRKISRKATRGL